LLFTLPFAVDGNEGSARSYDYSLRF